MHCKLSVIIIIKACALAAYLDVGLYTWGVIFYFTNTMEMNIVGGTALKKVIFRKLLLLLPTMCK